MVNLYQIIKKEFNYHKEHFLLPIDDKSSLVFDHNVKISHENFNKFKYSAEVRAENE